MAKKTYNHIKQNDNSIEFWKWYYTEHYKHKVVLFLRPRDDYKKTLAEELDRMQKSYGKRQDKASTDPIRVHSVQGQCNQIQAMQYVLEHDLA